MKKSKVSKIGSLILVAVCLLAITPATFATDSANSAGSWDWLSALFSNGSVSTGSAPTTNELEAPGDGGGCIFWYCGNGSTKPGH